MSVQSHRLPHQFRRLSKQTPQRFRLGRVDEVVVEACTQGLIAVLDFPIGRQGNQQNGVL